MRRVDRPYARPNVCAARPHIGAASNPQERWVDTGAEISGFDNHVYLCETSIREAAAALGLSFMDDDEIVRLVDENERLQAENDDATARMRAHAEFQDSIAVVLKATSK